MTTITEDYVSFETAKLLKEKGFDIICDKAYKEHDSSYLCPIEYCMNLKAEGYYLTPTLQMAMKWLREKHNLFIEIQCYGCGSDKKAHFEYSYVISEYVKMYTGICTIFRLEKHNAKSRFPSYEGTCEAAIKYCLENLI